MSDGPDAAGGLDGDAGDGDYGGIDGDIGGLAGLDGAGGLDGDIDVIDNMMVTFDNQGDWSDALCDEDGVRSSLEIDRICRPGNSRQLTEEELDKIEQLKNHPKRTFYGTHVAGHGYFNVIDHFANLAEELGCNRIDQVYPNFNAMDQTIPELADWSKWSPPFTRRKVPNGWYQDACGSTRLVRQYWQIAKPNHFFNRDPHPERRFDLEAGMVFEVTAVTWHFKEPDDFETRFQIVIHTYPEWIAGAGGWGIRKQPLKRYQAKAQQLIDALALLVQAQRPDWKAHQTRLEIRARLAREESERQCEVDPDCNNGDSDADQCPEQFGSGADVRTILTRKHKQELVDAKFEF